MARYEISLKPEKPEVLPKLVTLAKFMTLVKFTTLEKPETYVKHLIL